MPLYSQKGITLVELLVAVAIIVILASIAVPSYTTMRANAKKNICIINLKQIDGAVEQWGLVNDVDEGCELTPYKDAICEFIYKGEPVCPSGGTYTFTKLGQHPQIRCNIPGHKLPDVDE